MNKKYIYFLLITLLWYSPVDAAVKRRGRNNFLSLKNFDFAFGVGGSWFMGDLGGANEDGKHFLRDYDYKSTRPVVSLGLKLKTKSFYAFQADFSYGYLSGNDKYTNNPVRNNRNLSFRSPIFEITSVAQLYFGKKKLNNLYKIKTTRAASFKLEPRFYAFTGIGFLHFNPQARYNNQWVDLQPLSTEGQGLIPGTTKYSRNSLVIPVGIGVRNAVTRNLNIGLEFVARKTFTDYIDDVSTLYYDNKALKAAKGEMAAYLADPNKGAIPGATSPNADGTGAQRGEAQYDDLYGFIMISFNYRLGKTSRSKF